MISLFEGSVGYKWEYPDGKSCSGHCPKDREDLQNYYWLWQLSDLEKVVKGDIPPYSIRPYSFGELDTAGYKGRLASGHSDPESGRLIISLKDGDEVSTYYRPPLFFMMQFFTLCPLFSLIKRGTLYI